MDEGRATALPSRATEGSDLIRVRFHPVKGAVLEDRVPPSLVDQDLEKRGDAAHLPGQITFEIREVDEPDVRNIANAPPGAHVVP
jgi:hypothetical protein